MDTFTVYTANSGDYYGSKAKINLWDLPDVANNQISASVIRLSSFDGDYENSIQAGFHEPKSGNWSVYREDLDNPQLIGYWPKSLFTALAEKATIVSWGGVVSYPRDGIGPPMGSGHYSSELQGKAAFVKNIEIFDSNGGSIDLANIAKPDVNRGDCYNVTALVDSRKYGLQDGYLFYFGGPGGCSN
uniref:Neprosin PEP catalytic domain-containing protein n=1 Tax=Ananas comosus var. bracteatus TaxID=296719 RepID=A0A6V7PKA2_ANACO|nr:unnamed protein product [Ananas comosus var. bracteatus]